MDKLGLFFVFIYIIVVIIGMLNILIAQLWGSYARIAKHKVSQCRVYALRTAAPPRPRDMRTTSCSCMPGKCEPKLSHQGTCLCVCVSVCQVAAFPAFAMSLGFQVVGDYSRRRPYSQATRVSFWPVFTCVSSQ
jgi:hypothetical protein